MARAGSEIAGHWKQEWGEMRRSWEEWEYRGEERDLAWFEALVVCAEVFFFFSSLSLPSSPERDNDWAERGCVCSRYSSSMLFFFFSFFLFLVIFLIPFLTVMTKNSAHDIMSLPSQPRPIFVAREEEWHHRKLKAKIANEGRRRRKKKSWYADGGGGCYRTCDNSSNSSLVLFLFALIITTPTWFNYCFIKNKRRGFFCFVVLSSWGSNEQTAHKTSVTSHPCIRSHMGGLMKTNTITGADKWIKISWAETPSSPLSLCLSLFSSF